MTKGFNNILCRRLGYCVLYLRLQLYISISRAPLGSGEVSFRMEMLPGWHTEQIIHRPDQLAGKFHRIDKIKNQFEHIKNRFDWNRVLESFCIAEIRF